MAIRAFLAQVEAAIPSAAPCPEIGRPCGACGDGVCLGSAEDPLRGVCVSLASVGNPCNSSGDCVAGQACAHPLGLCKTTCPGCEDSDPCSVDFISAGVCVHGGVTDGTPCTDIDGNACTEARCVTAVGNVCRQEAVTITCPPDSNPCTLEQCDPLVGQCETRPAPNGTVCGSGQFCLDGVCIGGG